jgi:hypothetical protein
VPWTRARMGPDRHAAAGLKCPLGSGLSGLIAQRQPDT